MPKMAIESGAAQQVLPLSEIGAAVLAALGTRQSGVSKPGGLGSMREKAARFIERRGWEIRLWRVAFGGALGLAQHGHSQRHHTCLQRGAAFGGDLAISARSNGSRP